MNQIKLPHLRVIVAACVSMLIALVVGASGQTLQDGALRMEVITAYPDESPRDFGR